MRLWLLQLKWSYKSDFKKPAKKGDVIFVCFWVQFFEEAQATENYLKNLQDTIRKRFICDKNMSLPVLLEQIKELEVLV